MASKARRADVELRLLNRRYKRDLRRAQKDTKTFAKRAKGSLISGFKGGFGALAAFGTAGGLADIGQDVFKFEEALTRLDIQAKGKADLDAIRASSEKLRRDFGVTAETVSSGATELVNRLGTAAATSDKIDAITEASVASGAAMKDLGLVALKLNKAFGLKSADEMREGFSALIEVGKAGSVPLSEMAVVIAQSGSQFARFGKQGKEAAAELGALIQLAVAGGKAGGFGSASEAGTGLRAFITQLDQGEQKLRAMGIRVKEVGDDGQKRFLPLATILENIRKKNLVNKAGFTKVFGSSQARDFLSILLEQEGALNKLTAAGVKSKASQEDAVKFANSSAGKMKRRWQELRLEIEKVFTPERIELMTEIAGGLGKALGFVIDNWKLFLAAFVAVKAVQIGRSLSSWAGAARGLASGLDGVAGSADGAAAGLGNAAKKGSRFGKIASAIGPALALTVGFETGQALGGAVVAGKKQRFAAGQARQQKTLSRNERVGLAVQQLSGADVVTEEGALRPEFEKSLQATIRAGGQLTELQRQALVALQGFEDVEKATSSGAQELLRQLKQTEGVGPKTRQVVTSGISTGQASGTLAAAATATKEVEARQQKMIDALAAAAAALDAASQRPVEVKLDSDVVARANEKARDNKRRPAP